MERLEPTRKLAARIWWAFAWRALLVVFAGGFALGIVLGLISALLGISQESVSGLSGILGLVIGVAASIEVMYRILNKRFNDFQIVVMSPSDEPGQE